MKIAALAYCVIQTTDLRAWHRFAVEVAGFQSLSCSAGLRFKMDERDSRILVEQGRRDCYFASGWELRSEGDFKAAIAEIEASGKQLTRGTASEIKFRHVFDMAWFLDPSGNRHEISFGYVTDFAPFSSPVGVSEFVTGDLGLGHMVLPAPEIEETRRFLMDVMGFGHSDLLIHHPLGAEGPAQRIDFMHCDNARHHSLALFEGPVTSGCVHLMVEVSSLDEVGRAYDRMLVAGAKLAATLGKHTNDHMTSFYVMTPGGFALEYGFGGRTIDWANHSIFESTSVSLWGHDFSVGFDTAPHSVPEPSVA